MAADTTTGHVSFNWTVDPYGSDLAQSHVFLLWVNYGEDNFFNSHYFNMSAATSTSSNVPSALASISLDHSRGFLGRHIIIHDIGNSRILESK